MKRVLCLFGLLVLAAFLLTASSATCASCQEKADCPGSLACIEGVCEDCQDAAECWPGQVCDEGQCRDCLEHAECPPGFSCVEGRCRQPEQALRPQAAYREAFIPLVLRLNG